MPAVRRFRDSIRAFTTPWMSDRPASGKTVSFRVLWAMVAPLDAAADVLLQGLQAAWPGKGTPTALPLIGRTRGIIRGQSDTDEDFAAKLRSWLDLWRGAGSARTIARVIHDYLEGHPRVRCITRSGRWVTVEADGTVTDTTAPWDWDSVSHPERSNYWSDLWIVIYPSPFERSGDFGDPGLVWGGSTGLGHTCRRQDSDAVRGLLAQWKGAHTRVRCVIWAEDPTLFDPENPSSCPDGTWGAWGTRGASRAQSRTTTTCRYWEP